MDVRALLVADAKPPILVQPRKCTFDYPTLLSEAAAVSGPTLTDQGLDQSCSQLFSVTSRNITGITQKCIWPLLGPTPFAANVGNRFRQWQQLCHVVAVRLRDTDRKGNPLRFGNKVT